MYAVFSDKSLTKSRQRGPFSRQRDGPGNERIAPQSPFYFGLHRVHLTANGLPDRLRGHAVCLFRSRRSTVRSHAPSASTAGVYYLRRAQRHLSGSFHIHCGTRTSVWSSSPGSCLARLDSRRSVARIDLAVLCSSEPPRKS